MQPNKLQSIYLSIALAFICLLLPWSGFSLTVRPDFMLLVIIFWLIRAPNLCNVGTAWFVGLLVDLATGGIFGQYALAYTVTAFFSTSYQRRLVLYSEIQQLFYVGLLLIISQIILLIIKTFSGGQFIGWIYFLPSITGVLLWFLAVLFGLDIGARARDD
ncbi:MAG: rod shape-determining protein MreD [Methylotenera sp.]|nr:rod shape-determining protein MreD [Methylotenera sp.]MSP99001.1 rod shape-determining protein MreD [Methylotenera sp.]